MRKSTFILSCLFMVIGILGVKAQAPTTARNFDTGSVDGSYILYGNGTNRLANASTWGGETYAELTITGGDNKVMSITYPSGTAWNNGVIFDITGGLNATTVNAYKRIQFDVWLPSAVSGDFASLRLRNSGDSDVTTDLFTVNSSHSPGGWRTVDMSLSDFITGSLPATKLLFQSVNLGGTMYIDNIVLYNPPIPAAPTPTLNNPLTIWNGVNSGWSVNTSQVTAGGNACRELTLGTCTYTTTATTTSPRNALHVQIYAKTVPTNLQIRLNSGTIVNVPASSLVANQWNTVQIPLSQLGSPASITTVNFIGTGTIWVDNIIIYAEDGNLSPVAEVFQNSASRGTFNSIKAAHDYILANSLTGALDIRVFNDSKEPNQIVIDPAHGSSQYTSLRIYPTKALTVTFTAASGNSLFNIINTSGSKTVTIDGRINASGSTNSLTISAPYTNKNGSAVTLDATTGATVQYCIFKGLAPDNRPQNTLKVTGAAVNTNILFNHFNDCLLLDARLPASPVATDVQTAGVVYVDGLQITGAININDNHFFESTHSYFRSAIVRSYIYVEKSPCRVNNQIKIMRNKIGGSASNLGGTNPLRIGNSTDPVGVKAGSLLAINVASGWPDESGSPNPDANSRYILIEGNEIARITLYNKESDVYANSDDALKISTSIQYAGGFTGIEIIDGFALVRNNIIRDIELKSKPANSPYLQRLMFSGICSSTFGGISRAIIEDNQLYNFTVDYTVSGPNYSTLINGIFCQLDNYSGDGKKVAATIRNNRVIMRHMGTMQTYDYTDIHGISARVQNLGSHANNAAQLDVYNNVVILEQNKYTNSNLRVISPVDVVNGASRTNGIINLYNNIIAVLPLTNGFDGVTGLVAGINYVAEANSQGKTNIFHNSVFMRDVNGLGVSGPTAAMNMEYRQDANAKTGHLSVWNNNFNNSVNNVNASVYYSNSPYSSNTPLTAYFDYNNYYTAANGNMYRSNKTFPVYTATYTIKTFDNWKFSNLLPYWNGKNSEYDFHSRFVNTIDFTVAQTMAGLATAKTQFAPKRFLGGKKTDLTTAGGLGLRVIGTTAGSNTVTSAAMTDATNTDINNTISRRINLPTMGAVNTAFNNYWTGGALPAGVEDIVVPDGHGSTMNVTSNMTVRDIYSDAGFNIVVGAYQLTITGYVGMVGSGKINANNPAATIVYNGNAGHTVSGKQSAAAQHIFPETFQGDIIANLRINNQSQYFVLLHPAATSHSLSILRDFAIVNPDDTEISYPSTPAWLPKGKHPGGLNCTWYNTTLLFDAPGAIGNHPVTAYNSSTPYTYRPYAGQRIPRHAIYNDSVYNLTISSGKVVTYHDYLYVKHDLTISAASRSFEVAADKYVRVLGATTNPVGNNAGLVIKARDIGSAETDLNTHLFPVNPRPNATFISNTNNVPATVEMYSLGGTATGISGSQITYTNIWQYFTPAVISAPLSNFSAGTIYEYNPTGDNINPYTGGSPFWNVAPTNLSITNAYAITQSSAAKYSMVGNLNRTNFSILAANMKYYVFNNGNDASLNATWPDDAASKTQSAGSYLFGNPYTHAVAIKDITFPGNFIQSVYIYNAGTFVNWQNGGKTQSASSNASGSYTIVPKNNAGTGGLPATISSMQAFTVKFSSGTHNVTQATGPLTFNYFTAPTTNNTDGKIDNMQRAPQKDVLEKCVLEMLFTNGDHADYLLIVGNEGTEKGFDNGWDAHKELNEMQALSLYTIEQEKDQSTAYFQVSTMADLDQTYLGILVGDNENLNQTHELLFRTKNLSQHYSQLYLEDLATGELVDLLAYEDGEEFSYEFKSIAKTGEKETRFRIVTVPQVVFDDNEGDDDIIDDNTVYVYSQDQTVYVESSKELSGTVALYDMTGKCVLIQRFDNTHLATIHTNLSKGVYLAKIVAEGKTINKTIILK